MYCAKVFYLILHHIILYYISYYIVLCYARPCFDVVIYHIMPYSSVTQYSLLHHTGAVLFWSWAEGCLIWASFECHPGTRFSLLGDGAADITLYQVVLRHITLFFNVLLSALQVHVNIWPYIIPCCTIFYYVILYYILFHYAVLYCTVLFYNVSYSVIYVISYKIIL